MATLDKTRQFQPEIKYPGLSGLAAGCCGSHVREQLGLQVILERNATTYACLGDGFPEFVFAFHQCLFATQPTLQQDCSCLPVELLNRRAMTIRRGLSGPEEQPDCRDE